MGKKSDCKVLNTWLISNYIMHTKSETKYAFARSCKSERDRHRQKRDRQTDRQFVSDIGNSNTVTLAGVKI